MVNRPAPHAHPSARNLISSPPAEATSSGEASPHRKGSQPVSACGWGLCTSGRTTGRQVSLVVAVQLISVFEHGLALGGRGPDVARQGATVPQAVVLPQVEAEGLGGGRVVRRFPSFNRWALLGHPSGMRRVKS